MKDDDLATMLSEGRSGGPVTYGAAGREGSDGSDGLGAGGGGDLDTVPSQGNGFGDGAEAGLHTPDPGPAPVLAPDGAPAPVPGPDDGTPPGPGQGSRLTRQGGHSKTRQGRKVRQRLWAVDPWSVFKISVMFYACMFVIILVAGTVLWNVARSAGTIDDAESFVTRLAAYGECVPEDQVKKGTEFEVDEHCEDGSVLVNTFKIDDGTVFKAVAIGGAILAIAGSLANVLMAVLLNLINEVSGGMRYTIIREPSSPKASGRLRRAARSLRAQVKR